MLVRYLWLLHTTRPFTNVGVVFECFNGTHIIRQRYGVKYGKYVQVQQQLRCIGEAVTV